MELTEILELFVFLFIDVLRRLLGCCFPCPTNDWLSLLRLLLHHVLGLLGCPLLGRLFVLLREALRLGVIPGSMLLWMLLDLLGLELLLLWWYRWSGNLRDRSCLTREVLLLEVHNEGRILLQDLSELLSEVNEEVRVDVSSLQVLAMAVDVIASKELLIKEDDHSIVGMANDRAPQAKGDEFSL